MTADSRMYEVWQMETSHLINCIRHMERRNESIWISKVFYLYQNALDSTDHVEEKMAEVEAILAEGPSVNLFGRTEKSMYLEMRAEVLERTGTLYGYYHHDAV